MDFGSSVYKVKPGLKSYLFISEYSNVIDELLSRSLNCTYVTRLYHPFSFTQLNVILGVSEDSHAIVVEVDGLDHNEIELLEDLLSKPKVKNLSIFLLSRYEAPEQLRARVSKQGLCVYGDDPNTLMSRKHLSEWFGDETKTHVTDAFKVAQSLDWNLGAILWTMKAYQCISQGKVLDRPTSQKIMNLIAFQDPVTSVFSLVVNKKKLDAAKLAKTLTDDQCAVLIERLKDFLQGISVVSGAVKHESSDKKIAAVSGRSVNDVIFFQPYLSRYPFSTINKCNKLLDFTQNYVEQSEAAETVALLWAS